MSGEQDLRSQIVSSIASRMGISTDEADRLFSNATIVFDSSDDENSRKVEISHEYVDVNGLYGDGTRNKIDMIIEGQRDMLSQEKKMPSDIKVKFANIDCKINDPFADTDTDTDTDADSNEG